MPIHEHSQGWHPRIIGACQSADLLGIRRRSAQASSQCLQQLPCDGAVSLDQRTELPERQAVAYEVRRGCHGGGPRSAVDQRELAEIIAGSERRELNALAGNSC